MRTLLPYLLALLHTSQGDPPPKTSINALLTSFRLITESVWSSYSYCSHTNFLIETNSQLDIRSCVGAHKSFPARTIPIINLIVDLSVLANEHSLTFYYENRYHYKHHQPCTMVFYETGKELLDNAAHLNNATVGRRWPERILPLLPNEVARCFFVFFTTRSIEEDELILSEMNDLMHETGMILHSLFLVPDNQTSVVVFDGVPKSSLDLKYVTAICNGCHERILPQRFYMTTFNFNGDTILSLFCLVCAPSPEELEQSVPVIGPPKLAYILIQKQFNMTPNPEKIFGIPTFGINEDGGFDEFILPLVDGSAAFTYLVIPSIHTYHVLLPTHPYFFDAVGFLTAPPKTVVESGIYMIQRPLHWTVWVAIIISSFGILACIEIILYVRSMETLLKTGIHPWLIQVVCKPLLEQSSYEMKAFRHRIRIYKVHCILGLWSLSLLVLECAYDSALLDVVAFPRVIQPPQTFQELAVSHYEIGAIFAEQVEHDLRATNVTAYHNLAERLVEHDFSASSCYQSIFEREMACMGLLSSMNALGRQYLVDIYGRRIEMTSKDSHFFTAVTAGVSKFYPMLLQPLNDYISLFLSVGLSTYAETASNAKNRKKGVKYARENRHKKYYLGVETTSSESQGMNRQLVGIMAEILQYGGGLAVVAFVCELSKFYFYDKVKRGGDVDLGGDWALPVHVPRIYVSECRLTAMAAPATLGVYSNAFL